jgi:hypothetical protein
MIAGLRHRARRISCRTAWAVLEKCTSPPAIETFFERSYNGRNVGYVKAVRGLCLIDPAGYVRDPAAPGPFEIGLPSPKPWMHRKQHAHTYDTIVSFRHYHEDNYYHFLIDILGELELLDASGLGDLPIVIGGLGARTRFGSDVLKMGSLASRNWILQGDEYIWAENIVYLRSWQQTRIRADHLLDLMNVPIPPDHGGDRLYLARPPEVGRSILNTAEVAGVLKKHGFKEVITDDLPVEEQIRLFQRARYVVGAHGAGLTNLIYRRGAPLALLELHGHTWLGRNFGDLCREYGYYHERLPCVVEGDTTPWRLSRFWVDIPQLDRRIRRLLARG